MKKTPRKIFALVALVFILSMLSGCSSKLEQTSSKKFAIMWSIYAGWMPWPYAAESGIVEKWAKKYGIEIELKQADYLPSIEAYVAGAADGVLMTDMEAVTIAAAGGVDNTAIILGDYSNGNDAVITRDNLVLCDLKNKEVYIVEYSISHYLLTRGLEEECKGKITENDLKLLNVSEGDIGPAFINSKQPAMVTWNPIVLQTLAQAHDAKAVFNSSRIPREILDTLFIRTETLRKNPELGKALAGAWYETLALMKQGGAESEKALTAMAQKSGDTLDDYQQQLKTTAFWWTPQAAAQFVDSQGLIDTMQKMTTFSFDHGLYPREATSANDIGVEFPNGKIIGNPKNIKVRFTDEYYKQDNL